MVGFAAVIWDELYHHKFKLVHAIMYNCLSFHHECFCCIREGHTISNLLFDV